MKKRSKYYALNFMVAFLAIYGIVMYLPILQVLQKHFGVSVSQISWLPNIGYLNMIIFSPLIGILAKKVKINKVLVSTITLWVIGIGIGMLALTSKNFNLFILGRFIEGIGEASFFPILLTINDSVMKDENHSKFGASMIEIGSAIGGLVAGLLAVLMSNSLDRFLIVPIIIGSLTAIMALIVTKDIKVKTVNTEATNDSENKRVFLSLLLLIALSQAVFVSAQVYLSYYLKIFSMENQTGIIIAIEQVVMAVGALFPVILLKKFNFKEVRNIVIALISISIFVLSMNISYQVSVIALIIISIGIGISFTTLNIAVAKTIKNNFSQKMALYTSIRFLGGFIFSYTFGSVIGKATIREIEYKGVFLNLYLGVLLVIGIVTIIIVILQKKIIKNIEVGGIVNENIY